MISQRELRNDSGQILRAVEAGESFIVTRNGHPAAELRPLRRRTLVPRVELAHAAAHAPVLDTAQFRSDVDEVLDQESLPGD
ncbi:MAG: type II toxin-antitoxin system Phd/YefM family antitoxin [Sciscionella sp.]